MKNSATAVIGRTTFRDNHATTDKGGDVLHVDLSSMAVLDNCTVHRDDKKDQTNYFAQGTLIVRDTELQLRRDEMDMKSISPADSTHSRYGALPNRGKASRSGARRSTRLELVCMPEPCG